MSTSAVKHFSLSIATFPTSLKIMGLSASSPSISSPAESYPRYSIRWRPLMRVSRTKRRSRSQRKEAYAKIPHLQKEEEA